MQMRLTEMEIVKSTHNYFNNTFVKTTSALIYLLACFNFSQAQYTDAGPDNNYRSANNPYYWKNRLPFTGYWQQDVHYKINAALDETTDIITGQEELTYYNNSPDTLYYVYFNLYQNAFQPGSYLDNLQSNNDAHVHYGKYERAMLGTSIDSISSDGSDLQTQLDNTILKVWLNQPLPPNASKVLKIKFRTFYDNGSTRRRMKKYKAWGYNHYNGCQWYPKVCVYDRKSGWNTDQHLNREFYGDYGTFDVNLTFASNFVVEATGVLQNEKEVLPDSLKKKLDIWNFKNTKWDTVPSVITKYKKGETKTWKYHAENVHDFAFTADPTYRIHDTIIYPGRKNGEGVRCVAIVQEPHASGWQTAADYLAKIITVFSRDFGVFEYPKIVIADAADGMEYPMITMDGGRDKEYRGLLVHEVGHNWFYGMIGNNETYRAMLDEGFTQFLTSWGMEALDGPTIPYDTIKNKYLRRFFEPINVRDSKVYYGYLIDAIQYNDEQLNTHSDGFNGALGQGGGYRHVYMKTSTMLYNLQYVLGDSLFSAAMKHYVGQWKFAHPYPEDFRNSIIQFTHIDLNWFFDEWMETTKNIDYKVGCIKKGRFKNEYEITLKRKGRMQMPIDLQVTGKNDSIYNFYIPNTWFEKQVPQGTQTLPKWYGWDKLQPTYTAHVTIPGGIKNVVIDSSERLADINMLNNRKKPEVEVRFDSRIYPYPSWKKYRIWMRPDIWWNAYDGIKLGINITGNYMNIKHNFSFTAWVNTHLAQGGQRYFFDADMKKKAGWFSYIFSYSTAIDRVFKKSTFYFQSRWLDGCEMYKTGITKQLPHNWALDFNIKAFTRNRAEYRNYLLYPTEWTTIWTSPKKFNASINITATYQYNKEKFNGYVTGHLRSGLLGTSYDYHYFDLTAVLKASVWKLDFRTRFYGRIGTGKDLPSESALFFVGGNPEEMMDSKYYRAAGFVPESWAYRYRDDIGNLHFAGGMNMRGYAGYLLAEKDKNGIIVPAYKGPSGFAINAEVDFNRIVKVKKQKLKDAVALNTYLFGDAGAIGYNNSSNQQQLSQFRFDAGAGLAFTIKKWGLLQNIKPLTFRFDVPFFVSHAPYVNQKHFAFRWVVGISRTF
ncbi:MAG: M1 family metallopeptidase [Chitinophagales bacterium]